MLRVILLETDIVNNKGFSAIELLAIIVILTIITLISIPIILNVVNNQKIGQSREIVDIFGNNVEIAFERYKNSHDGVITTNFEDLKDYLTIDKVKCDNIKINENGNVIISECYVDGEKVLNDKSESYEYITKK